jgi:Family of unknown function (DUF5313)
MTSAEDLPIRRPDPLHWVWYALGGRLPERYNGWILSDATRKHWMLRHALKAMVQLAVPIALFLWFFRGAWEITVPASVCGLILAVFFALAYSTESVEHRTRRAGFAPGLAEAIRQRAAQEREAAATVRRHQANDRRAARRGWGPPPA